ncbi:MAG: DUF58 domain-containing protein [Verrucomicrobiota bacterium]
MNCWIRCRHRAGQSPEKQHPAMETNRHDLFDTEFLDSLRHLSLRLRRRRSLHRQGSETAGASGATKEFRDFRSYAPMDDVRSIDWGVYARLEKLVIRLYEDLQEVPVTIAIDVSHSMAAPHAEKQRLTLRIAVALAYLGALNQHRVSVFSMEAGLTPVLSPFKNGAAVNHLIEALVALPFGGA